MSIIRNADLRGVQNVERYFEDEIFQPIGKHDLEKVEVVGDKVFNLYFAEEENPSARNFVKQIKAVDVLTEENSERDILSKTVDVKKFPIFLEKIFITKKRRKEEEKYILYFYSDKCRKTKKRWGL